jgi:putative SOS response-associated peptidase YedK
MCGRFVQLPLQFPERSPWPQLAEVLATLTAKYNLAPTQRAAVVMEDDGQLAVKKLRWGLLPFWVKDLKGAFSTINARIETVATKPAYRAAFKAPRRCIVPMAGYYEWRGEKGDKQPFYITRPDGEPLYAAGLWEPRHPLQSEDEAGSCTLITHDAVDAACEVHDRMPVFLDPALTREWMAANVEDAMAMLLGSAMPPLTVYPVDRRVNSSRNTGTPDMIVPVAL